MQKLNKIVKFKNNLTDSNDYMIILQLFQNDEMVLCIIYNIIPILCKISY